MSSLHDDLLAGHLGQKNTTLLVKGRYIWFNLSADCKRFVSPCARCNISKKPNRRPRAAFGGISRWDAHGDGTCRYPLWLECILIPDQTAETVAKAVVDDFIALGVKCSFLKYWFYLCVCFGVCVQVDFGM